MIYKQSEYAIAKYKAKTERGSRIEISAPDLDITIHQMIVWLMHSPNAEKLLPAYNEIRETEKQ